MNAADKTSHNNVHILIAEDSPTQAERLKYDLERNHYQVTSASNGREAMEMIKARKPTLVISDIIMPEMDGYQLCSQIKSDPDLKNVPVILVTTLSDPHDVIRGLECRADNFIVKPYVERYLVSRIQFVLLNYEIRQHDQFGVGVEIYFNGQKHLITADRLQILNLLLSTYETAVQRNQELARAKDDVRAVNAALEASNKELEAFSYSVSHDLRAPLRAIDGFTQSLFEDYAEKLDENAKDLFVRVRNGCQRMGQLIDDLLNLSRLSLGELNREGVDLGALAKLIVDELQRSQPERKVSLRIGEGLIANGDARLLRIALENLLGNAWKFTSKRIEATIELGMMREHDEQVFFVRDNGAGFDVTFAEKLFGAFQRLHKVDDFPGTGIGLATVRRIMQRHGGRIWAEATVEKGATFYFTI